MNKIVLRKQLTPFAADYALWCAEQGALLRAGRTDALDLENLAEEIESLGRSDRFEIESRLKVLLVHLLKWRFQPEKRKPGWRSTIREQRGRIARRLRESPSLKAYPAEVLAEEYSYAVSEAADETSIAEAAFPPTCPFTIEQVLDPEFLPD